MKLVLKTTVIDRILKEIEAAQRQGREPDYIVLTEAEMKELARDCRCDHHVTNDLANTFASFAGGAIKDTLSYETRDFPLNPAYRSSGLYHTLRTVTTSKFHGVPLFVVPKEYMPA